MPNVVCICVCLYSWFITICGISPRPSSSTTRMPSRFDSSRISEMPGIFFSAESSEIFSMRLALFTWYGSSVMMIASRPPRIFSACAFARSVMVPRPVVYASRMPPAP